MRERKGNNIYGVDFVLRVPTGGKSCEFDLINAGREFKLKSITLDIKLIEFITGVPLAWEMNTTQDCELIVGMPGNPPHFTKVFQGFTPAPLFIQNGNEVTLYRPKQIFFDNWFIANGIHFKYACVNQDLLVEYYHNVTIQVEIEQL